MSKVIIRPAEDSDALIFLEVLNCSIREVACADYSPEVIDSRAIPVGPKSISRYVENTEIELRIIAEIDGEAVGIGATVISNSELRACYVAPEGLRRGVGTTIVHELERIVHITSGGARMAAVTMRKDF